MPNALIHEKSPYLLQHAENPVEWLPWGDEAFRRSREEDKPIFLSVGYSTCHWCHVMEHESFESEETAALLNRHFINVKVDREERPDVDLTYMTFVQATTGQGGWPMNVWLTPELTPILGGTYFPPHDAYGKAGFPTVIERIAKAWRERRDELLEQGSSLVEKLQNFASGNQNEAGEDMINVETGNSIFEIAFSQAAQQFDASRGGFSNAPKFPRPSILNQLLRVRRRQDSKDAEHSLRMVDLTLYGMAIGGMRDHIGGGFHRYSVDAYWHVPHYEKMLYDQGQLAVAYLEAYQETSQPRFADVAREIFTYVRRDLTHPEGGFYSAEDADSLTTGENPHKAEGAFYVWEEAELNDLLGKKAPLFKAAYGVKPGGNARRESDPHGELKGKNTLFEAVSEAELAKVFKMERSSVRHWLTESRKELFKARESRPRPHLDDKIITGWNGLMISGFAKGARVLGDKGLLEQAQKAAQFIRRELANGEGTLLRSYREGPSNIGAFAADYAFLIQGLLDLYEADGDIGWLRWAVDLQVQMDGRFLDREDGGYYSVARSETSILSIKEDYDGAEPAPNSVAALNLLRLAKMIGRREWEETARKILTAASATLKKRPFSSPQLVVALDFALSANRQIVITHGEGAQDLRDAVDSQFLPHAVLLHADGADGQEFLSQGLPALTDMRPKGGKAAAYICEGETCQLPITDPQELAKVLGR